jgi:cytochrome c peroxidase
MARDSSPQGELLALNTPTIFNAGLNFRLNWEGNFRSLERQAEQALRNPSIMASSVDEVLVKLRADPDVVRKALGVTIPPQLYIFADEVVE